jgi:predicted nucleotidyltransferase
MRLRHRKRFCGRNFKSRFIRKLSSDLNLLYGKKVLIFLDEYADKPASDVDLLISANVKGLKFYGLVEEIREALHKKVDVLEIKIR